MASPDTITPDMAVCYIEAHGIEVRTVGTSCLTVFAHYTRNGVASRASRACPIEPTPYARGLGTEAARDIRKTSVYGIGFGALGDPRKP